MAAPGRDELRSFLKDKLARFKHPHYVLHTQAFPMTVTGKVATSPLRLSDEKKNVICMHSSLCSSLLSFLACLIDRFKNLNCESGLCNN
jgi:hypothetical protein